MLHLPRTSSQPDRYKDFLEKEGQREHSEIVIRIFYWNKHYFDSTSFSFGHAVSITLSWGLNFSFLNKICIRVDKCFERHLSPLLAQHYTNYLQRQPANDIANELIIYNKKIQFCYIFLDYLLNVGVSKFLIHLKLIKNLI